MDKKAPQAQQPPQAQKAPQPQQPQQPQQPKAYKKKKHAKDQNKTHFLFGIDCSKPVEDKVFSTSQFSEYLKQRIKIDGKVGKVGKVEKNKDGKETKPMDVTHDGKRVSVEGNIKFSKRYLKYLTKKFLKKQKIRDYLYVIASSKNNYQIKYFNIQQEEQE